MRETQTARLAREHLTTVVDVAISNIKQIQKYATLIVYAIMGVSFFHQFSYLFKTFYVAEFFKQGTLEGYMHAVTTPSVRSSSPSSSTSSPCCWSRRAPRSG